MSCVETMIRKSRHDFYHYVWPHVRIFYPSGQLIKQSEDLTAKILDSEAGIDEQIRTPSGIIPVAVRVQYVDTEKGRTPYNSFTVRASTQGGHDTELHKMQNRCLGNYCGPRDMIHAYLDKKSLELLSAAAAPWENVNCAISDNLNQRNFCRQDGNWFYYAYFYQVAEHGLVGQIPEINNFKGEILKQLSLPLEYKDNSSYCGYQTDRFLMRYGAACP